MIYILSQQGPGHAAAEINTWQFKWLAGEGGSRAVAVTASFLPGGKNCRSQRAKPGAVIASRGCGLYERLAFRRSGRGEPVFRNRSKAL
jgi:hypothetical protein